MDAHNAPPWPAKRLQEFGGYTDCTTLAINNFEHDMISTNLSLINLSTNITRFPFQDLPLDYLVTPFHVCYILLGIYHHIALVVYLLIEYEIL